MTEPKECIVKVQQSQFSSDNQSSILVYDETREFEYQGPLTKALEDYMKGKPKLYANATLVPDVDRRNKPTGTFQFSLQEHVEEQEW